MLPPEKALTIQYIIQDRAGGCANYVKMKICKNYIVVKLLLPQIFRPVQVA
jgi:hypothetical protein